MAVDATLTAICRRETAIAAGVEPSRYFTGYHP